MNKLKDFYNANQNLIANLFIIIFVHTFIYVFIKYILAYIAPFFIGFIIYIILDPIATFLEIKLKAPRWLSALMAIIFLLTIISSTGVLLFLSLISQGKNFVEQSSTYMDQINIIFNKGEDFFIRVFFMVPTSLKEFSVEFFTNSIDAITTSITQLVKNSSVNFVKTFPKFVFNFFIGLISSFFIIKDKDLIKSFIKSKTPKMLSKSYIDIKNGLLFALCGYFKSQLILMSFTGIISFVGLTILGSQYSLFISFLIAIIDALPLFGSGFILWPWATYYLIAGEYTNSIILISTYLVVLLFRQIMEPRVLGKQIGLHPLITLGSIFIGLKLFGILGLLIGPVSAVICKSIIESNQRGGSNG